jgi:hypothetical protein
VTAGNNVSPDVHQKQEADVDREAEAIVRRALTELRAINPGCDCAVLWGVRIMLALALDERVIAEPDAFAALDLVRFLEHAQHSRRARFGLDETTVDGPLDLRAALEGSLVFRVTVYLGARLLDVADALALLDQEANDHA